MRLMLNPRMLACVLLAALLVLGGCATLTFEQRLALGYGTTTAIRYKTADLLISGRITADDAANVQAQAEQARVALDIARALARTSAVAAGYKLDATTQSLQGLQTYLKERDVPRVMQSNKGIAQ